MNIGYLYDFNAYPPKGGNHVHALQLTQGFVDAGHDVFVLNDPTMPQVTNVSGKDEKALRNFVASLDIMYVRIDARYLRSWSDLHRCLAIPGRYKVVWEINSPANEALAYSWLSGREFERKEGFIQKGKRLQHAIRKMPGIIREEKFRRRLARRVDAAICVSESMGKYASEDLDIRKVLVLPNGGPLISKGEIAQRRRKRESERFTVLYSGSAIYPWQGLDYLSSVIRAAEKRHLDMHFVLAVNKNGGGLGNSPNSIILEGLDRERILDEICKSDACVSLHPEYPWSKHGFHNSPMKLFEYMACARPSVTSNHGQMSGLINDGVDGLLCENTTESILGKILYLRDNPNEALSIGDAAWKRVQCELNWQINVKRTLSLFDSISK